MILFVFISLLAIPKMSPPISSSRLYSRGTTWQEKEAWRNKRTSPFGSREKKNAGYLDQTPVHFPNFPPKQNQEAQLWPAGVTSFLSGLKGRAGNERKDTESFYRISFRGEKVHVSL